MSWEYKLDSRINLLRGLDPKVSFDKLRIVRGKEQERTAALILTHLRDRPGIILGDEVGMGKTWIALLTAIPVAIKKPVLVLTPSRLLSNQWKKQFHDLIKLKVDSAKDTQKLKPILSNYDDFGELLKQAKRQGNGIFICSVGAVEPEKKKYRSLDDLKGLFELLILDEGHNFKNENTRRYQIFKTTREDKKFKQPLFGQAQRILILTATPFQLGHQELNGVLSIIESTSAPKQQIEEFRIQLDSLLKALDKYKLELHKFESYFKKLGPSEYQSLLTAFKEGNGSKQASKMGLEVRTVLAQLENLKLLKTEVNAGLLKFVIRNNKDKGHRKDLPEPLSLSPDRQLLFFITEQLGKVKRRHFADQEGHMAAVESSYARFQDHLNTLRDSDHHLVSHYRELAEKIYNKHYKEHSHPKLDQQVEEAFKKWIAGEKSLIFCFYTKTVDEFASKLEAKIKDYIEERKKRTTKEFGKEVETFRNNIGIANNMSSLVFRDNLFAVTLIPILERNNLEPMDYLSPTDKEKSGLISFLQNINFNPTGVNFHKLVTALTFHAFSTFAKKNKALIPSALEDDFKYILDPENMRKMYRKQDSRQTESNEMPRPERSRLDAIESYISNLLNDKKRLRQIMTHPTIWSLHRESLESLNANDRAHITEIVGSYLTSDEYIYLDLLPNFKERPRVEEIPNAYQKSKAIQGERAFDKVSRFLSAASGMASENLEKLAEEMHFRYQKNKMHAEKVIVESVTGDVSSEGKIRTVTAFRTPLPPYILISTSVLSEGVDLHTECRHVVHYDHEWNPAVLEQKIGRIDRVGSMSERVSKDILIAYPYIKHTQDEKAYRVVMARKSWFDSIMGEKYSAKWNAENVDQDSINILPDEIREALRMDLDNDAHENKK